MRTCIGCRQTRQKKELIRIVRKKEGTVELDMTGKVSGRGAYLCYSLDCLKTADKKGRILSALEVKISPERLHELRSELDQKISKIVNSKEGL